MWCDTKEIRRLTRVCPSEPNVLKLSLELSQILGEIPLVDLILRLHFLGQPSL